MPDLRDKLEGSREAILLGEFGGLLHMFGKASKDFLQAYSLPKCAEDTHQEQKHFGSLLPLLKDPLLASRFVFGSERLKTGFTDFFAKYKKHNDNRPDSHLLNLFNTCHGMTSADEKGVVRRKQPVDSMDIATPFGRKVRILKVDQVDTLRTAMATQLAGDLQAFLHGLAIEEFRERVIKVLKHGMSQTLGETREPANDVTLWAQSFGVASLYKSTLAALAMGKEPCPKKNGAWDYRNLSWRLFGIGWNGAAFLQRGRKLADIIERQKTVARIAQRIDCQLEIHTPVGNRFYSDDNGLFYTFPGIDKDTSSELVSDLGPSLIDIVRQESDNEIWPFLTLSRPRRSLTQIARQISIRDVIAASPCTAAVLILEDDGSESLVAPGPSLASASQQDVCPACRVRGKAARHEVCFVCRERRSGRQSKWLECVEGETIWINEIADIGNRLALLTLRVDADVWLSGEWLTSIQSQTFQDWWNGEKMQKLRGDSSAWEAVQGEFPGLNQESAAECLQTILASQDDAKSRANLLNTFFEEVTVSTKNIQGHLANISQRLDLAPPGTLSANDLAQFLFTQNPSPGRLMRVLEALDDFVETLTESLRASVFVARPGRLSFKTLMPVAPIEAGQTYRITVSGLRGIPLVVLARSKQEFLTADNLDKFGGIDSVKLALKKNGVQEWRDEDSGEMVNGSTATDGGSLESGYLPFTELSRSPVFSQLLLPADRLPDVLRILLDLEAEHFGSVRGKLALHVGVLVAKRKFPLYALLEAGRQIVNHPSLNRGALRTPWFNTDGVSDFYSLYPTSEPGSLGHEFSKLDRIEQGRRYWLTPGYFDFDYLGGTVDTQRLRYAGNVPERPAIGYGWLHPRPMPLFRLSDLLKIWDLLGPVGTTQRHEIAAALASRLEQWRGTETKASPVYARFARAVLQDAFTNQRWNALNSVEKALLQNSALDGLLLEAIEFFDHVVKGDATN